MYYSSASSPKDKAMMLKRYKQRKAGELKELAQKKEECMREIKEIEEQDRVAAEQAIVQQLVAGHMRVRDLVLGVDINELADDFAKHGNIKQSARKYGVAALVTIANSLQSDDERNRLVAAKIIVDAAAPTKDEGKPESKDVGFPAIVIEGM